MGQALLAKGMGESSDAELQESPLQILRKSTPRPDWGRFIGCGTVLHHRCQGHFCHNCGSSAKEDAWYIYGRCDSCHETDCIVCPCDVPTAWKLLHEDQGDGETLASLESESLLENWITKGEAWRAIQPLPDDKPNYAKLRYSFNGWNKKQLMWMH